MPTRFDKDERKHRKGYFGIISIMIAFRNKMPELAIFDEIRDLKPIANFGSPQNFLQSND